MALLLDRLDDEIEMKRLHLKEEKIRFHDDNAPSHTSNIAKAKKHGSQRLLFVPNPQEIAV